MLMYMMIVGFAWAASAISFVENNQQVGFGLLAVATWGTYMPVM
jgi:hypothetical protein